MTYNAIKHQLKVELSKQPNDTFSICFPSPDGTANCRHLTRAGVEFLIEELSTLLSETLPVIDIEATEES